MSVLREAMEHAKMLLSETLDRDFAFWSSPSNETRRRPIWRAYKALSDALIAVPLYPAGQSREASEWVDLAYRKPAGMLVDDQPRFTRYNMEVAFLAGQQSAPKSATIIDFPPTDIDQQIGGGGL